MNSIDHLVRISFVRPAGCRRSALVGALGVLALALSASAAEPYDRLVRGIRIPKTAWFDTGYVVRDSPRMTMQVLLPETTSGSVDVFGTQNRTDGCFILNADAGYWYLRYGTSGSQRVASFAADRSYEIVCTNVLVVNGEASSAATAKSMAANALNMCVPGRGSVNRDVVVGAFRLEDGGNVVRDMVPCEKDGALGYYDRIGEKFYSMQGSGTLVEYALPQKCIWSGGAGDGKWSSAANWTNAWGVSVALQNGDRLVIPATDAPLTVNNDTKDIRLAGLVLQGTRAVTIAGERYVLLGNRGAATDTSWPENENTAFYSRDNAIVSNLTEITIAGNATLYASNAVFGARIAIEGTVSAIRLECRSYNYKAIYRGALDAPGTALYSSHGGEHYFYGRVRVGDVWYPKPASNTWGLHFCAPENELNRIQLGLWGGLYGHVVNAFPTNLVCRWYFNSAGTDYASYKFYCDQTIDRIEGGLDNVMKDGVFYDKCHVDGPNQWETPCDLTLRGTTNALSYARLSGYFDLIWDPTGDYTQEFRDRISSLVGAIRVKGGSFVSGGTNVFSGVTSVEVADGASFDIASTNATRRAFPSLKELTLGTGAKLYLTNGVINAFTDGQVRLSLETGAKVILGAGAVQPKFKAIVVDGLGLASGTYSDEPWLEGGSVSTDADGSYWKSPVSGLWSDATKWTMGVPSATYPAFVTARAANADDVYVVTNDLEETQGFAWRIGTAGHGHAVVSVAGKITNTGKAVTVSDGGILDVPTGGTYVASGAFSGLSVGAGGEWRVSGGFLCLTNTAMRYFAFAGESAKTATVSVTSGTLLLSGGGNYPLVIPTYGFLKVTGDGLLACERTEQWGKEYVRAAGGRFEIGGANGYLIKRGWNFDGLTIDRGVTEFFDTAQLMSEGNFGALMVGDSTKTGTTVVFNDRSSIAYQGDGAIYVGNGGGSTRLVLRSDAVQGFKNGTAKLGNAWFVGCDAGYGELDVEAGFLPTGDGRSIQFGGTMSTATNTVSYPNNVHSSSGCTGVCHVAGGCLYHYGWRNRGWYDQCKPCGILVGYGAFTANKSGDRVYRGFVDVSGGVVTNQNSDTVIGAGCGYGEWNQSGGETQLRLTGARIGVVGGEGRVALTGGTFNNNGDTYVGGAGTNAFSDAGCDFVAESFWPIHRHDAIGTLVISGGTFKVSTRLYVGVDGEGTIEMHGDGGTLTTATLILSNSLVEAGTAYETQTRSKLKFVADANGKVSPIRVTSKATVTEGSRLEIDLTACADDFKGRIPLIQGTVAGAFAADDVTVLASDRVKGRTKLRQGENGISVSVTAGMVLIVR